MNAHLLGDRFLQHLLPLDPEGADFFSKFHDGVLMCRLVCLAIPGSIGEDFVSEHCCGLSVTVHVGCTALRRQ